MHVCWRLRMFSWQQRADILWTTSRLNARQERNGKKTHTLCFVSFWETKKTNKYLISSNIYRNVAILSQAVTRYTHVYCFSPFGPGMYQSHRQSAGYSVAVQRWKKIHLSHCYRPLLHGVVYKDTSIVFRIIILRRDLFVGVNKSQINKYIYINSVFLSLSLSLSQR